MIEREKPILELSLVVATEKYIKGEINEEEFQRAVNQDVLERKQALGLYGELPKQDKIVAVRLTKPPKN